MTLLLNLLVFIIMLGLIIAIHELGHLIFAKRAKILCYEYSLGMGPILYQKKGKETDFSIRAIPIGGFVSMAGEEISTEMIKENQVIGLNLKDGKIKEIVLSDQIKAEITLKVTKFEIYDEEETNYLFIEGLSEGNLEHFEILEDAVYIINEKQQLKIAPYNRCFESKTFLQKFLTLIAGPGMNFLLAILLFFVVASVQGKPQNTNIIGETVEYLPAGQAGLTKKDQILSVGGYEIENWDSLSKAYNELTTFDNVEVVVKKTGSDITETLNLNLGVEIIQLGIANFTIDGVQSVEDGAFVGSAFGYGKDVFESGDIIKKVKYLNEPEVVITSWYDLIEVVKDLDGGKLLATFLRDGELKTENIHVWEHKVLKSQGQPAYNISLGITPERRFSIGYSLTMPFVNVWESFAQVVSVLGLLFGGSNQIGVSDLSGPIGIFNIIGQIMQQGALALISFTAFLSVNIGVLNLLPIPALDGGRILFISYESITRRKIPRNFENIVNNVFFILLMVFFVYVMINDVLRIF